jgi:hypothetical protein
MKGHTPPQYIPFTRCVIWPVGENNTLGRSRVDTVMVSPVDSATCAKETKKDTAAWPSGGESKPPDLVIGSGIADDLKRWQARVALMVVRARRFAWRADGGSQPHRPALSRAEWVTPSM